MENNKSNGFLLGALVGIGLTLLFTTKKGKKIAQTLTENGLEGVETLTSFFENDLEDTVSSTPVVRQVAKQVHQVVSPKPHASPVRSGVKRFFKRAKK